MSPDEDDVRLQRVDAKRHRTIGKPYTLGGAPTDLAARFDSPVAVIAFPPQLHEFEPELAKPRTLDIQADGVPDELLLDNLSGWITDPLENLVIHFDTSTGKRLHRIAVGRKPAGIATEDGQIWVANRGAGTVEWIDAKTARKRSAAIDTKGPLSGPIAVAADVVWAAGSNDVVRIEPRAD
jgi:DNA-binding beta-propeller fold protein YncE